MRRLTWLVALLACVGAGAAAAQAPPQARVAAPPPESAFQSRPAPSDMANRYPPEAWRSRREGRVVLCCLVQENRRLACAVVAESPAGQGFGEAARLLSARYRLTPEAALRWRAGGAPILRLPMYFSAGTGAQPAPPIASEPQCASNR
ncbi:MAG: energy transducer TonB [Hyphomonadaceae bacterium]|nr:energy transducer TonB [Hyphomonadaceae bacterium]